MKLSVPTLTHGQDLEELGGINLSYSCSHDTEDIGPTKVPRNKITTGLTIGAGASWIHRSEEL